MSMDNAQSVTGNRRATAPPWLLAPSIAILYALHQDVWFWRTPYPLVFGFLPVALAYHAAYCIAAALLMWTLTTMAWPGHLEDGDGDRVESRR
jgi:hypothetical protein